MTARLLGFVCVAAWLSVSSAAHAGLVQGAITKLSAGPLGGSTSVLIVTVTTRVPTAPACVGTGADATSMVIDLATETGRTQATIATAAYFAGTTVQIFGDGNCLIHPDIETSVNLVAPAP
jgi:hypothetical protein